MTCRHAWVPTRLTSPAIPDIWTGGFCHFGFLESRTRLPRVPGPRVAGWQHRQAGGNWRKPPVLRVPCPLSPHLPPSSFPLTPGPRSPAPHLPVAGERIVLLPPTDLVCSPAFLLPPHLSSLQWPWRLAEGSLPPILPPQVAIEPLLLPLTHHALWPYCHFDQLSPSPQHRLYAWVSLSGDLLA